MSTGRAEGFGMTRRSEGERIDDAGAQLVESLSELGLTPNQSRSYVALRMVGSDSSFSMTAAPFRRSRFVPANDRRAA